jgi:hypothetical protein
MSLEQFHQMMLRQREVVDSRRLSQLRLFPEHALEEEEDVGTVRLLRLQAALRERRPVETEG